MNMGSTDISDDADLNLLNDLEALDPASSLALNERFGKGDMAINAIRTGDLEHPRTVADRAAQGDAQFEAELARDRPGLHSEAMALFASDREAHNRLIHKAWLIARRQD